MMESEKQPTSNLVGYICVLAAATFWATSGVAGKGLFMGGITPIQLVKYRVTFASALLALFLISRSKSLFIIHKRDLAQFLILGIVMAAVQWTYFFAISKIQVGAAILLQYLAPIIIAVFAMAFWKEKVTLPKVFALLLAFGGCFFVVGGFDLELLAMNRLGILGGLASAVSFAAYALLSEKRMATYDPWTVIFYALAFATVVLHASTPSVPFINGGYSLSQWWWMSYIAVMGTAIPFGLYLVGINHLRSTKASITATAEPILAALFAYMTIGEPILPLQVLGGAMVIGAVIVLQVDRGTEELAPAKLRAREKN